MRVFLDSAICTIVSHRAVLFGGCLLFLLVCAALSPAGPSDHQKVLASVDRTIITRSDLRFYLLEMRLLDETLWGIPDEALERAVISDVVDEFLLYQKLWRSDREADEADIKASAEAAWKRFEYLAGSPQLLSASLERSRLREADVRRWLEERANRFWHIETSIGMRIDPELLNRSDVTPDEAERVELAQIFVKTISPAVAESWNDSRRKALKIRAELNQGLSFENAALVYSDDDATAKSGGRIGWLDPGNLDESVRGALKTLPPGGLSEPIRGRGGWFLFKLINFDSELRRQIREASRRERIGVLARLRREKDVMLAEGYELKTIDE